MESRLRYRFSGPMKILRGADIQPGQNVLEVGCGTGFHTVSAAQLIGDQGCLVAMDVLSDYVEQTSSKVQAAALKNVHVVKREALDTGLDAESIDTVLLFSVIPSPTAPLNRLLLPVGYTRTMYRYRQRNQFLDTPFAVDGHGKCPLFIAQWIVVGQLVFEHSQVCI